MKLETIKNKISNKIQGSIFDKKKYVIPKLVITIIISIAIATILVVIKPTRIWDRIPIFAFIIWFALIHLIFRIKDIYEFIYKKRFVIAILFMIYVTIMGYSGSSIATYTDVIQGEYQQRYFTPILGRYRSIRSDEWSVNAPLGISQAMDKEGPYDYFNDNLRGTMTDMSSVGNPPTLDLSLIAKPLNIGYIILGPSRGIGFVWYGKLTLLMLAAFELCMIITNKRKVISLMGMLLITFSAATQWWYATEYFIWGMLVLVFFDKFMLAKNIKIKLLCSLGIFISGLSYIFIFYPAWQLAFGYVYLALFIWICLKNCKEYKFKWTDLLIIAIILIAIALMVGRYFIKSSEALNLTMHTDYPGERFELGGGNSSAKVVFSYVYSYLFPYVSMNNPCEYSGMISFYPIPMIIALVLIIKGIKDKDYKMLPFLIPMFLVALLFSVWTFVVTNKLLARITFLYMVPANRLAVVLGVTQVFFIIYIMAHIKENSLIKNKIINLIIALGLSAGVVYLAHITDGENIMKNYRIYVCALVTFITIYELINIDKEKNRKNLIGIFIIMSLLTGTTVNPIQRGISVMIDKPIARQIQKIVDSDKENNLWIVDSTSFYIPNYVLANGAKVINSTNIYPNFDLYKTVLGEKANEIETRKIYNRYAHLNVEISLENKLELLYTDSIKLYITTEKLKELSVKYIVSTKGNLDEFNTDNVEYEQIYAEYGLYIYRLNY